MPRLALGIAYDGLGWQGWQTQPHGQTIQDALENALERFTGVSAVSTVCAGRTDTGVHAAIQVVHIDTSLERTLHAWIRGTNSFLPRGISLLWAKVVPETFHARFCALSRTYTYLLWHQSVRPALWHGRAGWCMHPLNIEAMQEAAQSLIGEHDFSSFRSSQCQAAHPIRHIYQLQIEARSPFVIFTIRANAFLHHMVRNLMGALLQIGLARQSPSWMTTLLSAKNRCLGAPTFMADGLYLTAIEYPTTFGLGHLNSTDHLYAMQ